jgi:hypothetical protein
MKRCPTCQKEFPDSMRFCQTDGTSLVEVQEKPAAPPTPPPDPYKTVVGGSIKMDDDLLQLPEQDDPNKTMISPVSAPKPSPPKVDAPLPPPPIAPPKPPVSSEPHRAESKPQEPLSPPPPKTGDSGLNTPSFGDLSPKPSSGMSSGSGSEPARFDAPPTPPKKDPLPPPSPFGASPFSNEPAGNKGGSPFDKPASGGASPFDKPASAPPSPFEKTPPPPYKEPEPIAQSPFGGQQNDPFNQPFQQAEWTPPPAPVASWQDQGLGADTPFQSPVAAGGQNNTLAIVSLVCGILSVCLCGLLTGIPALITGYMAKNNADTNPAVYGGRGMALAGMILGGISVVLSLLYIVFVIVSNVVR